ncbi:hypothetical protein EDD16DRAFT_1528437 [Pisolithus croceorrhizus]|nr:hypothetical protein EDD16DRAFT_1528437 [Pisolithus croceorrhizus]
MSSQQHMTQQPISTSSHDWSQVTDKDLEVHTSDSEGTKKAKEVEKSHWEVAKKEHRAEACHQKAEEAQLERERKEQEECKRQEQEAVKTACQATIAEAESVWQSATKEKGHVGELQHESRGSSMARWVTAYTPMTRASMGTIRVAPMPRQVACKGCRQRGEVGECQVVVGSQSCGPCQKRKKKCSWAMVEEAEAAARPSRKRAGTGSLQGKGQKKGQPNDKEDDDNDKIEEVPVLAGPQSQAAYLCLVREMLVMGALVEGVPEPLYDKHMLIVQVRIAAVMEHLALAMEVQAGAVQAYMRHMTTFPPWPPVVWAGVAPGGVRLVAMGSMAGVKQSEPVVSRVAGGSGEWDKEDAEGEAEGMQE